MALLRAVSRLAGAAQKFPRRAGRPTMTGGGGVVRPAYMTTRDRELYSTRAGAITAPARSTWPTA